MRVLFVSSTTVGGSGRSQRELAARLVGLGHPVQILARPPHQRRLAAWWYERCDDAIARMGNRRGNGLIRWIESWNGRRSAECVIGGVEHRLSMVPERAFASVIRSFRPEVVVGNSIRRLSWLRIREECAAASIRTVLYIREDDTLGYFEPGAPPGDVFVANAMGLCEAVRAKGVECSFVPSVIEVSVTRTLSSRRVVLMVNPIETRGAAIVERVAAALPEVPFVVQESWPLSGRELAWVEERLVPLGNVEFRRASPPGPNLYRDARVLLVPYRVDNRPRVIAEAQANGIPVIVGDVPSPREAVGDGGVVVPLDDLGAWISAIRSMWADIGSYQRLAEAAERHSRRDEIDPGVVAARFVEVLRSVR